MTVETAARQWHKASDHHHAGTPFGAPTCNCLRIAKRATELGWAPQTVTWLETAIIEISRLTGTPEPVVRARIIGNHVTTPTVNPDCRNAKHTACAGDAWDETNDARTLCTCHCHAAPSTEEVQFPYTPTTAQVRLSYQRGRIPFADVGPSRIGVEFDRWISAHAQVTEALQAELADARTALEALGQERNTWARQMADLADERDTALAAKAVAESDIDEVRMERDVAQVEVDRLDALVKAVRAVIAPWSSRARRKIETALTTEAQR